MKTIGIIAAMPSEVKKIRDILGEAEIKFVAGYNFYINKSENTIINVCCGVGKVNAAVCAQVLIDNFKPDYLINCGTAGSMSVNIDLCDIVISKELMYHDLLPRLLMDYPPHHNIFEADKYLIELATEICKEQEYKSHLGLIVSGEQFFTEQALKEKVINDFSPLAVDMESAAIAHCAYRNSQPFIAIRCMSDKADNNSTTDFKANVEKAANRAAEVTLNVIDKIKE